MDLNTINAKIIKAEMLGDMKRVEELKQQLEGLKKSLSSKQANEKTNEVKEKVKYINIAKKVSEDRLSLKQMFVKAKRSEAEDEAKLFIASSSRLLNNDDEYEEVRKKKHKKNQDYEIIKQEETVEDCSACLSKIKKHLIVAVKQTIYLMLPTHAPFVDGYCVIRSTSHVKCAVDADENCLLEIAWIRKRICDMFGAKNLGVIFTETYFKKRKDKHHLEIECFPIKNKLMSDAKMFFRQGIMDCEAEWSLNKKLVDCNQKCVSKAIPKGLSYFWVAFGSRNDSYGHVIEDEQNFSRHFGHEIIAGLLDIERYKYTRPANESFDEQYQRVLNFKTCWKKVEEPEENEESSDDA